MKSTAIASVVCQNVSTCFVFRMKCGSISFLSCIAIFGTYRCLYVSSMANPGAIGAQAGVETEPRAWEQIWEVKDAPRHSQCEERDYINRCNMFKRNLVFSKQCSSSVPSVQDLGPVKPIIPIHICHTRTPSRIVLVDFAYASSFIRFAWAKPGNWHAAMASTWLGTILLLIT